MILDYSLPCKLKIDIKEYISDMINKFPIKIGGKARMPWADNLFKERIESKRFEKNKSEVFHTYILNLMCLSKQWRPDIITGVTYLSTRVKEASEYDWSKLIKILSYLKNTINDVLTLEADDNQIIRWHVNASCASHEDMRSHTGACISLGKGMIASYLKTQKVNTRSST